MCFLYFIYILYISNTFHPKINLERCDQLRLCCQIINSNSLPWVTHVAKASEIIMQFSDCQSTKWWWLLANYCSYICILVYIYYIDEANQLMTNFCKTFFVRLHNCCAYISYFALVAYFSPSIYNFL